MNALTFGIAVFTIAFFTMLKLAILGIAIAFKHFRKKPELPPLSIYSAMQKNATMLELIKSVQYDLEQGLIDSYTVSDSKIDITLCDGSNVGIGIARKVPYKVEPKSMV